MMKKTKTTTIVIATALTTLLSASAAFANTTSSNTVQTPNFSQSQPREAQSWFKSHLDSLETSGTLNHVHESTIQNDSAKGGFNRGNHFGQFGNILDGLVKAGTITQAQEDAIRSGTKLAVAATPAVEATPAVAASHSVDIITVMDGLVKLGIITQSQEDAIQAQLHQLRSHQL